MKAALGKFAATPQIDFDTDLVPVQPFGEGKPESPEITVPSDYNPFNISRQSDFFANTQGVESQLIATTHESNLLDLDLFQKLGKLVFE